MVTSSKSKSSGYRCSPEDSWVYSTQASVMKWSLGSKPVGSLFSAKVPRSSAEVRRVFVHHIVEVEVVGQQEEHVNQRDEDEEGEEVNGSVEERQQSEQQMTHARVT